MKPYIGAKIIMAHPCGKESFEYQKECGFDGRLPEDNCATGDHTQGYHVEYSNPDGSTYHSWSPKDVFERAYRPVSEDELKMVCNVDEKDIQGRRSEI